ncbi:MAG TPA: dTDP-4-dehydrorhamnose reductase, partial [Candidatus Brocadiia bacterium]|nr:dTDP-4-dehydrorhamnose reductase [Candidatus Brocadiia bacterium]
MNATFQRILIVGHKGMLGHDLVARVRAEWPDAALTGLDLPDIDITRPASIRAALDACQPQVIFNCAAFTNVDACETQTETAMAVNGKAPGLLAAAARQTGAHLIHVSTDYIFDGLKGAPYTEDDPTAPISAYGRSKLVGEEAIRAQGGTWTIARTAWLYGRHGRNFVDTMLRLAREKPELSVVTDQAGSPTWTRDLAAALC